MCKTTLVNLRNSAYDVYIGRKQEHTANSNGHYGNPFSHKAGTLATLLLDTRQEAVKAYREWLKGEKYHDIEPARRQWILNNLHLLKDKTLGCFCKPLACHGDVLVELVEKLQAHNS